MSRSKLNSAFKMTALAAAGVAVGMAAMSLLSAPTGPRRSLASVQAYQPSRLVLGKQAAAMSVEIVGPESYPKNSTETVELVGFITQHLQGDTPLDYKWTLPAGVSIVQGQITGTLDNPVLGQPQRVSMLVNGFTNDKQKLISLSTHLEKGNSPLQASAVIVSRPEDTTEKRVQRLQARAAELRRNKNR
jgi:hypothetical protein